MNSLLDRARRGAELLDMARPGWAAEIVVDRLAMESCDDCILGQLYGGYFRGYAELRRQWPIHTLFSAAAHGFTIPDDLQRAAILQGGDQAKNALFAPLTEAWREEISRRLAPAH